MKTVLTIAGSDPCGGAGIQADIKTMTVNGVYAMSVVTALTVQNTTGVHGILEVPAEFVKEQLDDVFTDIRPDAVKIGMLPSEAVIKAVAEKLREYQAGPVVLDPVLASTGGTRLTEQAAVRTLQEELFPLAALITPNLPETEALTGRKIVSRREMEQAAGLLSERWRCAVLCKGGHRVSDADDLLYADGEARWIAGKRIDNPNTHGTGCTLSSAIAGNLAKGDGLYEAVGKAKDYLNRVLSARLALGKGIGPMAHAYPFVGGSVPPGSRETEAALPPIPCHRADIGCVKSNEAADEKG